MLATKGKQLSLSFSAGMVLFTIWIYPAKSYPKLKLKPENAKQTISKQVPVDGTWEGSLGIVKGPGLSEKVETLAVRLIISGGTARVFAGKDLTHEIKPGKFKAETFDTNAVIFASNSGHDNEGTWIETWAFVVTVKDHNTLITNHYRVVNNVDLPPTSDHSKFSKGYSGELKRISP